MNEAKHPFVLTPDKLVKGAEWAVGTAIGAGVLYLGLHALEAPSRQAFEINNGCTGSEEFPVTSREPLQDVYDRVASLLHTTTGIRPTDTQLQNNIFNQNFGTYNLSPGEIKDLEAGKVPNGYSVLLVPEKCPDPNQ